MRLCAAGGIQEGGDAGVGGPDKLGGRDTVGSELPPFTEEIKEQAVQGTGGRTVPNGRRMPGHLHAHVSVEVGIDTGSRIASLCRAYPVWLPRYLLKT